MKSQFFSMDFLAIGPLDKVVEHEETVILSTETFFWRKENKWHNDLGSEPAGGGACF